MPSFPQAIQQKLPTAQAPNAKINPSQVGIRGRALQKVGQDLDAVRQQFENLRNLNEYTKASTFANKSLSDIETQAADDNDIYNLESKYSDSMKKIRNEAVLQIQDRSTRLRFEQQLDTAITAKQFDIRQIARKKQVAVSKYNLEKHIETSTDLLSRTNNKLDRQRLMVELDDSITNHVAMGVVDPEKAMELRDSIKGSISTKRFRNDIELDPKMALKNLDNGEYENLPYGDKKKLEEEARNKIERDRKEAERIKNEGQMLNAVELTKRAWNDDLSIEDVEKMMVSGQITREFAEKMHDKLTKPEGVNPRTKATTFNELQLDYVNLFNDDGKPTDQANMQSFEKFLTKVVDAQGNGLLDNSDAQRYTEQVMEYFNPMAQNEAKQQLRNENPKKGLSALVAWIDAFDGVSKEEIDQRKAEITRQFLDRIKATPGQDHAEVVQGIIAEEQKRTNPNRSAYKIGQILTNSRGEKAKVIDYDKDGEPILEPVQ